MNNKPENKISVISYVWLLIVVILVINVIFIAAISYQNYRLDDLTEESIEYHSDSLQHIKILSREFTLIRGNIDRLSGSNGAAKAMNQINHSLYVIHEHNDELVSIQNRFADESIQLIVDRLESRIPVYTDPELYVVDPHSDLDKTRNGLDAIILILSQLERLHSITNNQLIKKLNAFTETGQKYLVAIMLFLLVTGIVITTRIIYSIKNILTAQRNAEENLYQEKELSQITLQSIGDAVITTDDKGTITYMNPVAEELTKWSHEEGVGLPLYTVFNVINEETGQPNNELIKRVLHEGIAVGLANHTVLICKDDTKRAIEDSAAPILDQAGEIKGIVIVFHDVTYARKMAQEMSWQASHDALTQLYNRHKFENILGELINSITADSHPHAFLYLDLDQFKIVNDTCGHIAGDELLRQVSTILKSRVRDIDTVARLGGDEFGILLNACPIDQAHRIANQIRESVQDFRFAWENKSFTVAVSIGLVPVTDTFQDVNDVMRIADIACYAAKDIGRNRIHIYHSEDEELKLRQGEMEWVTRINHALEENRFLLYQQKIVSFDKDTNDKEHFEILVRMLGEKADIIPPMAFIPAAERYNLMPQIDSWVISHAFEKISTFKNRDINFFSLNLSGQSLGDDKFLDFVINEIERFNIPPGMLCFEITETAAIINFTQAIHFINVLKQKGCLFALDDFGSGISSFGYLKNLAVDFLKIDGGFVRDMLNDRIDYAMVESINSIGHTMNILTIAEFVENEGIAEELRQMGVNYGQGFGLSRPEPL